MANLLNLNVDSLFEQHSVAEIDIVQKKIQTLIEQKREELRTMVGDKYRDLLKAADTIGAMKISSAKLIQQIEAVQENCRTLNERQLLGFKTAGHEEDGAELARHRSANKQKQQYFSVMIQIKLLTALPELIWSAIDREHFYTATELFIFSRHISTGLQLDANNPVMRQLPVAKKQWEILKPFHVTIKQSALQALQREDLSADVTLDSLLSLLLLEKSSVHDVLGTFLQLRCQAFLASLTESAERRRVKEKILGSLRVLNETIALFGECFMENGLLFRKLEELSSASALPSIALMGGNEAEYAHMLPDIIANFRPKLDEQKLDPVKVQAALEQWLADTARIGAAQLAPLFEVVSTMAVIQEIKTEAKAYRDSLNFCDVKKQFPLQHSLDFYELQYKPLINQRIRDIIRHSWQRVVDSTYDRVVEAQASGESQHRDDLWSELASDLPLSLEQALSDDQKIKQLLMRTRGYGSEVTAICTQFDQQLESIIGEMTVVLLEDAAAHLEDKLNLIEFLKDTSEQHLNTLMAKLKALALQPQQRRELLLVARVCVALVELSPHLKVCFCQQSKWRQCIGDFEASKGLDRWQHICQLIEEESLHFWLLVVDGILAETPWHGRMPSQLSHEVILEDFAMWETVKLQQKDEQDNTIESTFRIPSQPRISLQLYLSSLIGRLNECVPQTLPAKVLHAFNNRLLAHLLDHYEQMASAAPGQNAALQLYFDVRFLHSIFMVSRDERSLCDRFAALQTQFKDIIDPFDFELFVDQITANIKRSVVRLNYEFGVLTPQSSGGLPSVGGATRDTQTLHEKEPNVLSLSSCGSTALWFPLLPIVTQSAVQPKQLPAGQPEKQNSTRKAATNAHSRSKSDTDSKLAATTTTTATSAASKAKSGAASFFGAMSQDWFR